MLFYFVERVTMYKIQQNYFLFYDTPNIFNSYPQHF